MVVVVDVQKLIVWTSLLGRGLGTTDHMALGSAQVCEGPERRCGKSSVCRSGFGLRIIVCILYIYIYIYILLLLFECGLKY